ncbi:unnamed protein product, partial [Vitis vinifera]
MYVGFSASTGEERSSHYILGWSFCINGTARPLNLSILPVPPIETDSSSLHTGIKVLITGLAVILLVFGAWLIRLLYRRKMKPEDLEDWELDYPHRFRYKDLYTSTKGFKVSEGWCKHKNDLLLVYDYIPNGSLDSLLFHPPDNFVLSWDQRFKILRGIAAGLLYLHEEWEKVVIHRDVKASNVLIDSDMNGRLGDFGLARLYDHGKNSHTTSVVGTIGPIRPADSQSSDHFILMDWVFECYQAGQILDAVDPRMNSVYVVEEVELVLRLGLFCSHPRPEARPTMRQVTRYLSRDDPLPIVDDWAAPDSSRSVVGKYVPCSDNTQFIFQGFKGASIKNLSLNGASFITSTGALQLTNSSKNLIGRAFYSLPLHMFKANSQTVSSFTTTFVFVTVPLDPENGGGHGLAFTLAPSKHLPGARSGQYLGVLGPGNNASYYANHTHPKEPLKLESGTPIQAWIEYDATKKSVNVTISPLFVPKPVRPLLFPYKDLFIATKGFKDSEILGSGGFDELLLVYDLMPNGSLGDILFNHKKLGDFGLARLYDHGKEACTTHILVRWVAGCIIEAADPKLDNEYVSEEMELVMKLGLICCQKMPEARPTMRQVTCYLDGSDNLPSDISPEYLNVNENKLYADLCSSSLGGTMGEERAFTEKMRNESRMRRLQLTGSQAIFCSKGIIQHLRGLRVADENRAFFMRVKWDSSLGCNLEPNLTRFWRLWMV